MLHSLNHGIYETIDKLQTRADVAHVFTMRLANDKIIIRSKGDPLQQSECKIIDGVEP